MAIYLFITWETSVYTYSFHKLDGGNQSLSLFQGKKMLIVTLPVQQSATQDSLLYSLDTLAAARQSQLTVIGVPSREDGYLPSNKNQLRQWYRSKLGNYIVLADGMYTRKSSGSQQHGLFKWLTTVAYNEHFNIDVEGPWMKFFVKSNGILDGVINGQSRISGQAVQKTLRIP